ncbi:MAG: hypothetical protein ACK4R3_10870 [Aliihoeflea sp.]
MSETVSGYQFRPADLGVGRRTPGISIFMRVRNGADFLEAAIRSHAGAVDEIVAVHNQCTDGSDEILHRLAVELGPKLRVIHYRDRVFPPGSEGHAREAADSPASFVNMSNFALAQTRHTVAMKLDDDHVAIADRFASLAARVRSSAFRLKETLCFSGINLARGADGSVGVPAHEPLVGTGDHFLFEVRPDTSFRHDPRFEHFNHADPRVFGDITYWHLKYLKAGLGFANYELDETPNPRFERKKKRLMENRRLLTVKALAAQQPAWAGLARHLPLPEKTRLKLARAACLRTDPPALDLDLAALRSATGDRNDDHHSR